MATRDIPSDSLAENDSGVPRLVNRPAPQRLRKGVKKSARVSPSVGAARRAAAAAAEAAEAAAAEPPAAPAAKEHKTAAAGSLSLSEAARVDSSKHRCLASLHAALAELLPARSSREESSDAAAQRQAQLDEALHAALSNQSLEACLAAVRALTEAGASCIAENGDGRPAMHAFLVLQQESDWGKWAAAVVEALLAAGADPRGRGTEGFIPLQWAVLLRHPDTASAVIAALLEGGADPSPTNPEGKTLLHEAIEGNLTDDGTAAALEVLLQAGVDPLAVDDEGNLAAYYFLDDTPAGEPPAPRPRATQVLTEAMGAALQEQLEARERDHNCVVCMQQPRTTAFLPCGHYAFCATCAEASIAHSDTCPVCRAEATGTQTIHQA